MSNSPRDCIFVSYCHQDEKRWLDDLLTHLKPVLADVPVTAWSDKQIEPGSKWFAEIKQALERTRVAVLLVTPHFLASDFIRDHELNPLLREAEAGGVQILWIPIRACSYQKSPLKAYQAVIDPAKPLALMKAERDAAWVGICEAIERAVNSSGDASHQMSSPAVTNQIRPALSVVHGSAKPHPHRRLVHDLERSIVAGELQHSLIAPIVLTALSDETELTPIQGYDGNLLTTGVRLSDEYFVRIRTSAGERDWQRDFPQIATPILVGLARSIERSPDVQALLVCMCNALAKRLRVRLIWPDDPDEFNGVVNAVYKACLRARDLEDDDVLLALQELRAIGPK